MPGFTGGNRIGLLESGAGYFPALEAALDAARVEVHLQCYIFEADQTGERIAAALERAARRGVAVHVVVDGFGSKTLPAALRARMRAAGVGLLFFRPELALLELRRSRLRRLHHKIATVDGRVAFVGGINIIDDRNTPGDLPPRWDYAVSVEGPLVREIQQYARRLWERVARTYLRRRWRGWPELPRSAGPAGAQRAAFVVRDNFRRRRDIEDAYLKAIGQARDEILIACAYFLPGRVFRRALLDAAARGVRVRLLLQARVEYLFIHYATRALYRQLLAGGVEIVEYYRSFLHAKVAVVDRRWATVGSSNIDPLSLLLAREANVVVEDAGFAAALAASLETAIAGGARPVVPERWRPSLPLRSLSWIAYGVARLLLGWTVYGVRKDYL
jgi:cardiolipin synthase